MRFGPRGSASFQGRRALALAASFLLCAALSTLACSDPSSSDADAKNTGGAPATATGATASTTTGGTTSTSGTGASAGTGGTDTDPPPTGGAASTLSHRAHHALPAEFVHLTWNARQGAVYSLDVRPVDGDWIGPCVGNTVLGAHPAHFFDGRCPSAGNQDVQHVEAFRLCSSTPAGVTGWDSGSVECRESAYAGGSHIHLDTPSSSDAGLVVRWPFVPAADYALHLELEDGTNVDNCIGAARSGVTRRSCSTEAAWMRRVRRSRGYIR